MLNLKVNKKHHMLKQGNSSSLMTSLSCRPSRGRASIAMRRARPQAKRRYSKRPKTGRPDFSIFEKCTVTERFGYRMTSDNWTI